MTPRKFFRSVIRLEVISTGPYEAPVNFEQLGYNISAGPDLGTATVLESQELNGQQTVAAMRKMNWNPEWFELDENGNDLKFD